ncbi:ABC transporter substrate-binding protein [Glaciimonas immobilis]|nr:ABC transporter substrate-binding protein [Glaciimonas immobilis]
MLQSIIKRAVLTLASISLPGSYAAYAASPSPLTTLVVPGPVSATTSSPWCASGKTVKFAGLNWESGSVLTEVMRTVMEQGYGCKTESIPGNTVAMEVALSKNDIQVLAEEWVGRSDAWNTAAKAGSVVPLGKVIVGATEGWYVPEYVIKGDASRGIKPMAPALKSVADLPTYKALFKDVEEPSKGRFLNCPTGWTCEGVNTQKLKAYKLTNSYVNFRPGTGPALDAAITSDYQRGKPLLFYYWAPNALMGKFKFIKLQEPAFNAVCFKTLADKEAANPCGSAAPEALIQAGVSSVFRNADPVLSAFLSRVNIPLDVLNKSLAEMADQKLVARQVAHNFLKQYPEIWKQWVPNDVAIKLTASVK